MRSQVPPRDTLPRWRRPVLVTSWTRTCWNRTRGGRPSFLLVTVSVLSPFCLLCLLSCLPSCWSLCPSCLPSFTFVSLLFPFVSLLVSLLLVDHCVRLVSLLLSFASLFVSLLVGHCVRFVPSVSLCLRSCLPSCPPCLPSISFCFPSCFPFCWSLCRSCFPFCFVLSLLVVEHQQMLRCCPTCLGSTVVYCNFSRMRSEGFSFNSGGLGVEPCSRPVVSMFATVRNRSQPLRRCHWGKLLERVSDENVTCQIRVK